MGHNQSKFNSNSTFQSSLQSIEDDYLVFKSNYQQIKEENMKTIKEFINSPISFGNSFNLSFYDDNHLILSDSYNHKVFKIELKGKFVQFIGKSTKGNENGYFNCPRGIFISRNDRIFVADLNNHRIQIFNGQTGDFQSTFGSNGDENGQFKRLQSISIDNNDRIFVSDSGNQRIQIFDSTNQWISQIKSNNQSNEDYIKYPSGIVHNSEDYLFICDWNKNRIVCFDRNNQFTFNFGSYGIENDQFGYDNPQYISIDRWDQLMISDNDNSRISIHNSDGSFLSNIPTKDPFGISSNKNNGMIGVLNGEYPKRELKLIEIETIK